MELRSKLFEKKTRETRQTDLDGLIENSLEDEQVNKTIEELKELKVESKNSTKIKEPSKNIHQNHRQRLKTQFIENGIDSLTDIQKLELLLFYAIPQKDTNPIAHRVLDEVGSLKDVFTADISKLTSINGIKENSAILINLVSSLFTTISKPNPNEYIGRTSLSKAFCEKLYVGVEVEQFYVICLSKSNRVKKYKLIKAGTADEISIQIRSITEFALETKCNRIIVSHNHPASSGSMSDEDCRFTYSLLCSCMLNSIEIVDHIIVGIDRSISMHGQKILDKLKQKAFDRMQLSNEKRLFISSLSADYIVDD